MVSGFPLAPSYSQPYICNLCISQLIKQLFHTNYRTQIVNQSSSDIPKKGTDSCKVQISSLQLVPIHKNKNLKNCTAFSVSTVSIRKPIKLCVCLDFRFNLINMHVNRATKIVTQTISGHTCLNIRAKRMKSMNLKIAVNF